VFPFATFCNPPNEFRGTDFWMLNDSLNEDDIAFQIAEMKKQGIASFIARTYIGLKSDYPGPQFKQHLHCIVHAAREQGLKVFLQAGYMPEAVLDLPAELALRNLTPMPKAEAAAAGELLAEDGELAFVAVNTHSFVDMLNHDAIAFYLKQSYEDMWEEFRAEFGKTILSVWVDEPSYSSAALPWSNTIAPAFQQRWGYELKPKIPLLYRDRDDFASVRYHYWLVVQELLKNAYFIQVRDWCHRNNLLFSGHLMHEDSLAAQLQRAGATMPYYKYFDIPGIDYLTAEMNWRHAPLKARSESSGFRQGLYTTPLQCCSAAQQAGQSKILAEIYGVSSENLTLRDQKNMFDHFASFGVNHKSVHGIFYSLRGRGKRAYPPHVHYYQPYWQDYKSLTDYCARASMFISQGQPVKELLVIHPLSSAACEYRGPKAPDGQSPALGRRDAAFRTLERELIGHQCELHLGDEDSIAMWGKVIQAGEQPRFQIKCMSYQAVLLPDLKAIASSTLELLEAFAEAGGKLIILGETPSLLDGWPDDSIRRRLAKTRRVKDIGELLELLDEMPKAYALRSDLDPTTLHVNHRRDERYDYFFIFNSDCAEPRQLQLTLPGNAAATLLDPYGTDHQSVDCALSDDGCRYSFAVPEGGSAMLLLDRQTAATPRLTQAQPHLILPLPGPWRVSRQHPNALVLEFAQFRKGDSGQFSKNYPILAIQQILSEENYQGPLTLRFHFRSVMRICGARLVCEAPEQQQITLNGLPVAAAQGYFWAREFQTSALPEIIVGDNVLEIQRHFQPLAKARSAITSLFENLPGVELEMIAIIGDFAVHSPQLPTRGNGVQLHHRFTLQPETASFAAELTSAGYPFYTGTIKLEKEFELPAEWADKASSIELLGGKFCVARVLLNGQDQGLICWEPSTLSIKGLRPGKNVLRIELTNTLKNLLGPFHRPKGDYGECWGGYGFPDLPWLGAVDEFTRQPIPNWYEQRSPDSSAWTENFMLAPFGISAARLVFH
jgi:hypothetical protein